MKKNARKARFLLFTSLLIPLFGTFTNAQAIEYMVTKITNDEYTQDDQPRLNNKGQIVWLGNDVSNPAGPKDFYLYDGSSIKIMSNGSSTNSGDINDNGSMVWAAGGDHNSYAGSEIYYNNGTETIQLTNNSIGDWGTKINNSGQIVWHTENAVTGTSDITLYDGINTVVIGQGVGAQINDNGQVVWRGKHDNYNEPIYFYNGTETIVLGTGYEVYLNNNGQVVWFSGWGTRQIYLYDGTSTILLGHGWSPKINDLGQVAWKNPFDWGAGYFYFYNGVSTAQISALSGGSVAEIALNNNGQLAWSESANTSSGFISNLYTYDGTEISTVHSNIDDGFNFIGFNDLNDIVWSSWDGNEADIFLARTITTAAVDVTNQLIDDLTLILYPGQTDPTQVATDPAMVSLNNFQTILETAGPIAAANQLKVFIINIENDIRRGTISADDGGRMIEQAQQLSNALTN